MESVLALREQNPARCISDCCYCDLVSLKKQTPLTHFNANSFLMYRDHLHDIIDSQTNWILQGEDLAIETQAIAWAFSRYKVKTLTFCLRKEIQYIDVVHWLIDKRFTDIEIIVESQLSPTENLTWLAKLERIAPGLDISFKGDTSVSQKSYATTYTGKLVHCSTKALLSHVRLINDLHRLILNSSSFNLISWIQVNILRANFLLLRIPIYCQRLKGFISWQRSVFKNSKIGYIFYKPFYYLDFKLRQLGILSKK